MADSTQPADNSDQPDNPAADLIRQKLASIYAGEPDAKEELDESESMPRPKSKHQQFMQDLGKSGKSLPEIQTAWHDYYTKLPDEEKHAVWQEFYDYHANNNRYQGFIKQKSAAESAEPIIEKEDRATPVVVSHQLGAVQASDKRSLADLKKQLLRHINHPARLSAKSHFKSLGFGISLGLLVVFIFLFSFFNEVIITPFIQPSRHVNAIPLIIGDSQLAANATPEIIIPKINVEIPVDYTATSDDENIIESDLNNGVVHYPSTVLPGQNGNAAFFGHSSNNILNPGKYKFAFVLLHTLVNGDTFYLTYHGKLYAYQVIDHKIVPPTDVGVLNDTEGKQATATLITCDPPGTSINRLVVTGVQISPSPSTNTGSSAPAPTVAAPQQLASNGPSLWSRLWHWL